MSKAFKWLLNKLNRSSSFLDTTDIDLSDTKSHEQCFNKNKNKPQGSNIEISQAINDKKQTIINSSQKITISDNYQMNDTDKHANLLFNTNFEQKGTQNSYTARLNQYSMSEHTKSRPSGCSGENPTPSDYFSLGSTVEKHTNQIGSQHTDHTYLSRLLYESDSHHGASFSMSEQSKNEILHPDCIKSKKCNSGITNSSYQKNNFIEQSSISNGYQNNYQSLIFDSSLIDLPLVIDETVHKENENSKLVKIQDKAPYGKSKRNIKDEPLISQTKINNVSDEANFNVKNNTKKSNTSCEHTKSQNALNNKKTPINITKSTLPSKSFNNISNLSFVSQNNTFPATNLSQINSNTQKNSDSSGQSQNKSYRIPHIVKNTLNIPINKVDMSNQYNSTQYSSTSSNSIFHMPKNTRRPDIDISNMSKNGDRKIIMSHKPVVHKKKAKTCKFQTPSSYHLCNKKISVKDKVNEKTSFPERNLSKISGPGHRKKMSLSIVLPKRSRVSINIPVKRIRPCDNAIQYEKMKSIARDLPKNHVFLNFSHLIDLLRPKIVHFNEMLKIDNLPIEISNILKIPKYKTKNKTKKRNSARRYIANPARHSNYIKLSIKKLAEATYSDVYLINGMIYKILPLNVHFTQEDFLRECLAHLALSDSQFDQRGLRLAELLSEKQFSSKNTKKQSVSVPDMIETEDNLSRYDDSVEDGILPARVLPMIDFFFLEGDYNRRLLTAWDCFAKNKKSNNDRPSINGNNKKNSNNENPLKDRITNCSYACVILPFHGQDLESFKIDHESECLQIFLSIFKSLVRLEATHKFEHRDLHWGNILIRRSNIQNKTKCSLEDGKNEIKTDSVRHEANGNSKKKQQSKKGGSLRTKHMHEGEKKNTDASFQHGLLPDRAQQLEIRLIDFGLCRFSIGVENRQFLSFNDLSNSPTLFTSDGSIQYDVYRDMANLKISETETSFYSKNMDVVSSKRSSRNRDISYRKPFQYTHTSQMTHSTHDKDSKAPLDTISATKKIFDKNSTLTENLSCTGNGLSNSFHISRNDRTSLEKNIKLANWSTFSQTNLIWLRYILEKLNQKGMNKKVYQKLKNILLAQKSLYEIWLDVLTAGVST